MTGVGVGATFLKGMPALGKIIDPSAALEYVDPAAKKIMADVALNAARSKGATYTDIRIGRYLISPTAAGVWPLPIRWIKTVLPVLPRMPLR
jgi:hypothetical protein